MNASHEILIETRRIGAILRVTAVDAASGTEVVFQAPAHTGHESLKRLAAAKLVYVMNKGVSQGDFCKKATKLRDFGMG